MSGPTRNLTLASRLAACAIAMLLAACGGGGGGASNGGGCTSIDPTRNSALPGCGASTGTPTTPTTPAGALALTIALTDAGGAAIIAVTPDKPGTVAVSVKDSAGTAMSNSAVTLSSTDLSATFLPASGSALTDAAGVARIGLPAGTSAGAYTLKASATLSGQTATGTLNYSVVLSTQPVVIAPLSLALGDSGGAAMTTVTPERSGVLAATIKDSTGVALPNVAVIFSSTDDSAVFVPASGTVLSDAQGVARIGVPAGGKSGAFTATAIASKGASSAKGTFAYAVSYPALTLSALRLNPSPLSAGGTATVAVTVQNGALAYAPPVTVSFTSTCANPNVGKAILGPPVLTVAGVATTSYVDKGCGVADPIVATLSYGGATTSQTGTITTLGTLGGQIVFVAAQPANIALKGTGGPGRQESSVLTFKVLDRSGKAVPGVTVDFSMSAALGGAGGASVSPSSAVSTADGSVVTSVFAGTVNTPVRVQASINDSNPLITTLSDQLVVSTGLPHQNSFSLSTEIYNVEGANLDGCIAPVGSRVTARLADHFNNPVPDGTAVSFTAEGASIGASCTTTQGACSVDFCSANPRKGDGRITVLAYALGEESYVENPALPNSINRYDNGESFDDLCEPVRIDNAIRDSDANANNKDSRSSACRAPVTGETYIDSNGNGSFSTTGDGLYNGVLNVDPVTGQTTASNRSSTTHVRGALVQVMSTSQAAITPIGASTIAIPACVDGTKYSYPTVGFEVAIRDSNSTVYPGNTLPGNVLPAGTKVEFTTSNGDISNGPLNFVVANNNDPAQANWTHTVVVKSDVLQGSAAGGYVCLDQSKSGALTITVTTPKGTITKASYLITD